MMKILCIIGYYLPGYKAGGPIRTLANMVEMLGDEFEFNIVTADRDLKDNAPYQGSTADGWNRVGKAKVFYMSPKKRSLLDFKRLFCSVGHDVIYLNSFFSPHFTIKTLLLTRLRMIPGRPLIVAPRGEFSPGALGLKSYKKQVYLFLAKAFGLYSGVVWQASSKYEKLYIRQWFGKNIPIIVAPNLPPSICQTSTVPPPSKKITGCLKILFLSRISRKKNLDGALNMLKDLKGEVQFNIYGLLEDSAYWSECQRIIESLPLNIEIKYQGAIAHEQVSSIMMEHDLFFLPTLGENFGHVILEALVAGCPVLISDQTPWRALKDKGVGWDLPLSKPMLFQQVLQDCLAMDNSEYEKWSERAREYGHKVIQDDVVVEKNRQLFYRAVEKGGKVERRKYESSTGMRRSRRI